MGLGGLCECMEVDIQQFIVPDSETFLENL